MAQLKCPKCGEIFTVEASEYEALLSQVRNTEFEKELHQRLSTEKALLESEHARANEKANAEAEKRLQELRMKAMITLQNEQKKGEDALLAEKSKVADLEAKLQSLTAVSTAEKQQAILQEQNKHQTEMNNAKAEIAELKQRMIEQQKMADEEIARYKEMKLRKSTKEIGESLELFCYEEYERQLRMALPNAYFEKDNDIIDGTKADFIWRNKIDEIEIASICFEMKNENDDTKTKHKNEDFLDKLHADRLKKKCEYAILVSMLEPESELYNQGIVSKCHRHEKMYVVRPDQFCNIIMLINQMAMASFETKKALVLREREETDLTDFMTKVETFKIHFSDHCKHAQTKYDEAIGQIDKAIADLQKVKEALRLSAGHMDKAIGNIDNELSYKALSKKNPTVAEMLK